MILSLLSIIKHLKTWNDRKYYPEKTIEVDGILDLSYEESLAYEY